MRLICTLLLISLFACNGNQAILPDANSTLIDVQTQSSWQATPLDNEYIIQFPSNYKGGIGPSIEGPEFSLQKEDQRAYFLGSSFFTASAPPLATPRPDSLTYPSWVLNRLVTFRRSGHTQGFFYYSAQPKTQGQLYLLRNGKFALSMSVQYDADLQQEVLGILQTIHPK